MNNKPFYESIVQINNVEYKPTNLYSAGKIYTQLSKTEVSASNIFADDGVYPCTIQFITNELEWMLGQKLRITIDILEEEQ